MSKETITQSLGNPFAVALQPSLNLGSCSRITAWAAKPHPSPACRTFWNFKALPVMFSMFHLYLHVCFKKAEQKLSEHFSEDISNRQPSCLPHFTKNLSKVVCSMWQKVRFGQSPSRWKTDLGNTAYGLNELHCSARPTSQLFLAFYIRPFNWGKNHLWIIFCYTSKLSV